MKRILLVNTNTERMPYPVAPIGLCMLANELEGTYQVQLFDGVFQTSEEYQKVLDDFRPQMVGFSLRNVDNLDEREPVFYLDQIRKVFVAPVIHAGIPFVIGGSGFSIFPQQILKFFGAPYGIVGDGELSFKLFLDEFFGQGDVARVYGVVTPETPIKKYEPNTSYEGKAHLDRWVDMAPYMQRGAYSVQTKRGCYHCCVYCSYPIIEGRRYRLREVNSIVDEIEAFSKKQPGAMFEFVDSTFNDPPGFAEKICDELIARELPGRFRTMGMNPAHVSKQLIDKMRQAGFVQIDCTPDTASPKMLKSMQKNFDRTILEQAATVIRESGLPTMWFFILGGPGETEETMDETLEFIEQYVHPLDMVHITSGLRVLPGTDLQEIAIGEGIIDAVDDLLLPKFYFSPKLDKHAYYNKLNSFARRNLNFVPSSESKPSPAMMQEAMRRRKDYQLAEPMFRTLLKIRHDWVKEGKMKVGSMQ